MHSVPERVSTRPGPRIICALFCQPPVYIPALHGPSHRRPEKVWSALPLQDGRIHEEHAARERAIHAHDAANSMCVILYFGYTFTNAIQVSMSSYTSERQPEPMTHPSSYLTKLFCRSATAENHHFFTRRELTSWRTHQIISGERPPQIRQTHGSLVITVLSPAAVSIFPLICQYSLIEYSPR